MARDLLIGTYTQQLPHVDGHADGILAARLDADAVVDVTVAAETVNPSWVASSSDGSVVYAVGETEPDGSVSAFARSATGELSLLNTVSSGGAAPAHLCVHPTLPFLITGTYGSGTVSVFALNADGSLAERTAFVEHHGRGPVAGRQDSPHVHQLSVDPLTDEVVVVDLGLGELRWYRLSASGELELRPEATVVLGSAGPRHVAHHPDGRHILVADELDSTVAVLRRHGDRFVVAQSITTRVEGATGENKPAAVCIAAGGRTALVSNRGDDTVSVYAFDPEASRLAFVSSVAVGGASPRDLVISPDGDRVLAACQDSDSVSVLAFDEEARTLQLLGSYPAPTPVCVAFA